MFEADASGRTAGILPAIAGAYRSRLEFLHFRSKGTKKSGPGAVPVIMDRYREFVPLAPLGERVASHRRCHQPGREGGPTFCLSWG